MSGPGPSRHKVGPGATSGAGHPSSKGHQAAASSSMVGAPAAGEGAAVPRGPGPGWHTGGVPASMAPPGAHTTTSGRFHALGASALGSAAGSGGAGTQGAHQPRAEDRGEEAGVLVGVESDGMSNADSCSGESEDQQGKNQGAGGAGPSAQPEKEKKEKMRAKNEKKHLRQKERRAQELKERCAEALTAHKLHALVATLQAMGFSRDRCLLALVSCDASLERAVNWILEGSGGSTGEGSSGSGTGGAGKSPVDVDAMASKLKLDLSGELARMAELETRMGLARADIERAVVACQGDMERAAAELMERPRPSQPGAMGTGGLNHIASGRLGSISGTSSLSSPSSGAPVGPAAAREEAASPGKPPALGLGRGLGAAPSPHPVGAGRPLGVPGPALYGAGLGAGAVPVPGAMVGRGVAPGHPQLVGPRYANGQGSAHQGGWSPRLVYPLQHQQQQQQGQGQGQAHQVSQSGVGVSGAFPGPPMSAVPAFPPQAPLPPNAHYLNGTSVPLGQGARVAGHQQGPPKGPTQGQGAPPTAPFHLAAGPAHPPPSAPPHAAALQGPPLPTMNPQQQQQQQHIQQQQQRPAPHVGGTPPAPAGASAAAPGEGAVGAARAGDQEWPAEAQNPRAAVSQAPAPPLAQPAQELSQAQTSNGAVSGSTEPSSFPQNPLPFDLSPQLKAPAAPPAANLASRAAGAVEHPQAQQLGSSQGAQPAGPSPLGASLDGGPQSQPRPWAQNTGGTAGASRAGFGGLPGVFAPRWVGPISSINTQVNHQQQQQHIQQQQQLMAMQGREAGAGMGLPSRGSFGGGAASPVLSQGQMAAGPPLWSSHGGRTGAGLVAPSLGTSGAAPGLSYAVAGAARNAQGPPHHLQQQQGGAPPQEHELQGQGPRLAAGFQPVGPRMGMWSPFAGEPGGSLARDSNFLSSGGASGGESWGSFHPFSAPAGAAAGVPGGNAGAFGSVQSAWGPPLASALTNLSLGGPVAGAGGSAGAGASRNGMGAQGGFAGAPGAPSLASPVSAATPGGQPQGVPGAGFANGPSDARSDQAGSSRSSSLRSSPNAVGPLSTSSHSSASSGQGGEHPGAAAGVPGAHVPEPAGPEEALAGGRGAQAAGEAGGPALGGIPLMSDLGPSMRMYNLWGGLASNAAAAPNAAVGIGASVDTSGATAGAQAKASHSLGVSGVPVGAPLAAHRSSGKRVLVGPGVPPPDVDWSTPFGGKDFTSLLHASVPHNGL